MTDTDDLEDGTPSPSQADSELLDPAVLAHLQPRYLSVLVLAVTGIFGLASIVARTRDLSEWVILGAMPLVLWSVYIAAVAEEERIRAIRAGQRGCDLGNSWRRLRLRHARMQRISPNRGRRFITGLLVSACISLALLTKGTLELVKYLVG